MPDGGTHPVDPLHALITLHELLAAIEQELADQREQIFARLERVEAEVAKLCRYGKT